MFLIGPHGEIEEGSDRDGWGFTDISEPDDVESDWPLYKNVIRWLCKLDTSSSSTIAFIDPFGIQFNANRVANNDERERDFGSLR